MTRWKIIVPAAAIFAALLITIFVRMGGPKPVRLTYSEFVAALDAGEVASLRVLPGEAIRATWKPGAGRSGEFEVIYPDAAAPVVARAERAGTAVTFEALHTAEDPKQTALLFVQLALFGGLFYLLFAHVRGQGAGTEVGRQAGATATTFKDVAGTQGAADELSEVVDFLRQPARFVAMGARVPKGVLLIGPPGTGKTLLARAVAGEAGVPFYHLSGSEVTGFIVGLGAHRVRGLFKKARKKGGVIFIDEMDALGGTRGGNRSHNEDDRTLNQLLVEMDGFSPSEGVVLLGATNRPEALDPALKRPGRFDRTVTVGLPAADGREAILALHAARRAVPLDADVDFRRLARLTPGASGADLANLLNEAAIAAVREQAPIVAWRHFEVARDRMLLGKERTGFRAQPEEWRIVAVHEAGHALAGVLACPEDGLHKVTIQPRGQAMGVAYFSPDDDRHLHSRQYLEAQIIKGLGGRVAEEIVFGAQRITGGAESDLVQVNRIARKMIYRLGMGEKNGLLVYDDQSTLSPDVQSAMDDEVRTLLGRLYEQTRTLIGAHRQALDALAEKLLELETLDGADALRILAMNGVELPS